MQAKLLIDRGDFLGAYRKFWQAMDDEAGPHWPLLSYEICDDIRAKCWPMFMGMAISWDVREMINLFNNWGAKLREWHCWFAVLEGYGEQDAWTFRSHFLEPIAFYCILQPSAMRDRFGALATTTIHQANLQIVPGYEDRLEQDKTPGRFLSRGRVEKQLSRIGTQWSSCASLEAALANLDGKAYRNITADFRNRASHSIAPRFEIGHTNLVTRSIAPLTELVDQGDGAFMPREHPTKRVVRYGVGGIAPLSLRAMLSENEKAYESALSAFSAYKALTQEILKEIPDSA